MLSFNVQKRSDWKTILSGLGQRYRNAIVLLQEVHNWPTMNDIESDGSLCMPFNYVLVHLAEAPAVAIAIPEIMRCFWATTDFGAAKILNDG